MTTLSNADKRNRLDEAYDLKERVEQRAQGASCSTFSLPSTRTKQTPY